MIVVFGKTVDEITDVIDLEQVWRFNVEENKIKFFKDNDTWTKPNLEDIGTPQKVMKYISYALTNKAKICFITIDTIKAFREEFNGEREKKDLMRKEKELRKIMEQNVFNDRATVEKIEEFLRKKQDEFESKAALSKEKNKDVDNT